MTTEKSPSISLTKVEDRRDKNKRWRYYIHVLPVGDIIYEFSLGPALGHAR